MKPMELPIAMDNILRFYIYFIVSCHLVTGFFCIFRKYELDKITNDLFVRLRISL